MGNGSTTDGLLRSALSTSIRPLLASGLTSGCLNPTSRRDLVLAGTTLSGTGSIMAGISEVPAGHIARFRAELPSCRGFWSGLLEPMHGSPKTLAQEFRDVLHRAVDSCVAGSKPVAVLLSGGINSSAIAAAYVESVGADNVCAYTYEFDGPTHNVETPFAVKVCRHLAIRNHRIIRIGLDSFLNAIPETIWRAEHIAHWTKAFELVVMRRILEDGFDRCLTGFGVGSHMAYLEDLS